MTAFLRTFWVLWPLRRNQKSRSIQRFVSLDLCPRGYLTTSSLCRKDDDHNPPPGDITSHLLFQITVRQSTTLSETLFVRRTHRTPPHTFATQRLLRVILLLQYSRARRCRLEEAVYLLLLLLARSLATAHTPSTALRKCQR